MNPSMETTALWVDARGEFFVHAALLRRRRSRPGVDLPSESYLDLCHRK
jgi:hypothetical protein